MTDIWLGQALSEEVAGGGLLVFRDVWEFRYHVCYCLSLVANPCHAA